MQASDRVVYGRSFRATPRWLWLAQRGSGALLGPLVFLHMTSSNLAGSRALNAVLLAMILLHGYSGLRRLNVTQARFGLTRLLALGWCVVVALFGALLVIYR